MPDKQLAVDALETTIAMNVAVRDALLQVITRKRVQMLDVTQERADVAQLNQEIADCRTLLAEVRAASTVVSAPTVAEIQTVKNRVREIQKAAVDDAVVQAGLEFFRTALTEAGTLRDSVKT